MSSEINMTELYFEWWLKELMSIGLVQSFEREPNTFVLRDSKPIFYNKHFKSKAPLVLNFNLFNGITYTPDYSVMMSRKLVNKLFGIIHDQQLLMDFDFNTPGSVYQETLFYTCDNVHDDFVEVWFDVKPPSAALQFSGSLGSSREFPYNQRMMFEKYNIIVNKVVPIGNTNCLFAKTFMPKRYNWTDKSGAIRKLKDYEKKFGTLESYLTRKNI